MKKHFIVYASSSPDRRNRKIASPGRNRRVMASSLDDNSEQMNTISNYLPSTGEGSTMASQIATAVMKLVYKWFNDGDVYDNTHGLDGWANDLSSFANWLYKYATNRFIGNRVKDILEQIYDCGSSEQEYEDILEQLVDTLSDGEDLENWANQPKQGSVYRCDGPFVFEEISEDDEDEEYY